MKKKGPQSREQYYVGVLDRIPSGYPEDAHGLADAALIRFLKEKGHAEVAKAWLRCCHRVGFWYA